MRRGARKVFDGLSVDEKMSTANALAFGYKEAMRDAAMDRGDYSKQKYNEKQAREWFHRNAPKKVNVDDLVYMFNQFSKTAKAVMG